MQQVTYSIQQNMANYILQIYSEVQSLSKLKYFQPAILTFTCLLFFIIGRRSYESKYTNLLNSIDDVDNQKKRLLDQKTRRKTTHAKLLAKKDKLRIATLFMICCCGAYIYLYTLSIQVWCLSGILVLGWLIYYLRLKYLSFLIQKSQNQLKKRQISASTDIKQLINLLGVDVTNYLKNYFSTKIDQQRREQQAKQCARATCRQQKATRQQIYNLYKNIIAQLKTQQWCAICIQRLNIQANQLKLNEVQNKIKNYKNITKTLPLQNKKQLTNLLLQQWQKLQQKIFKICKRGCCIRYRIALQKISNKHFEKIKYLKAKLNNIK